jgi:hypothetical protein
MMVNQFKSSHHGMMPEKIQLTPQAALALALKEAYGDSFMGVPVVALPFTENEVTQPGTGTRLGIFMHGNPESLRSCDLR